MQPLFNLAQSPNAAYFFYKTTQSIKGSKTGSRREKINVNGQGISQLQNIHYILFVIHYIASPEFSTELLHLIKYGSTSYMNSREKLKKFVWLARLF